MVMVGDGEFLRPGVGSLYLGRLVPDGLADAFFRGAFEAVFAVALAGLFAVDFLAVEGAFFAGGFFALDFAAFLVAAFFDGEDAFFEPGLADFLADAFLVVAAGFLPLDMVVSFVRCLFSGGRLPRR